MSECRQEQITCPHCQCNSPMTVWESINVTLDPEIKDQLLNGELFRWKCEICGSEAIVPFGTLYHDMTNKFMLFFSPWDDENTQPDESIDIPGKHLCKGYTFREVFGINHLREKIAIFEAQLNDIAVERMKFFLRLDVANEILPNDELYFLQVDTSAKLIEISGWERGAINFIRIRDGKESDVLSYKMEAYYDYLLAVKMDSRMCENQCSCVDENWMKTKLQTM